MAKLTLKDVDVTGKTVLMRVDFNVPVENGKITDDNRIRQALPSINYLLEREAKLILTSHLGRPGGSPDPEYSLKPVAGYLHGIIKPMVYFAENCICDKTARFIVMPKPDEEVLLKDPKRV